ncbi:MAG TPA: SIMPL domain-containing protein [Kribbella sp.]|jgi:hypothetical protein
MDSGITVTGTGEASAPADVLRLLLGVGRDAEDVATAVAAVAERTDAVTAALRAGGVDPADIQTSTVNIYPQYRETMNQVAAYRASHSLTVSTTDLNGFGRLLNAAVDAAGNDLTVDHVGFDVTDKKALLDEARKLAFAQAREKAARLAELAGQSLGSIAAVEETYGHSPIRAARLSAKGDMGFAPEIAVSPGDQTVEASLTVRWSWA